MTSCITCSGKTSGVTDFSLSLGDCTVCGDESCDEETEILNSVRNDPEF